MKRRRHIPADDKAKILKRHLIDGVPISDLCDEYGIHPTLVYSWQRKLFENAPAALERTARAKQQEKAQAERVSSLEEKLQRKDEVLAELMEEHVALKKKLGVT